MSDEWGGGFGESSGGDGGEGGSGGDGCFKCGETGHRKSDCPQNDDTPQTCFKCKSPDHKASECDIPDKCRNCGQEGHIAKNCEEPEKCRRCGEEGHKVAECEKEPETRVIENEDGTTREIYVPKEVSDEKLFDSGISSGINFDKFDKIPVRIHLFFRSILLIRSQNPCLHHR